MREATFFSSAAVYSDAEGAETVLLSVPPEPGRSSSATPAASASTMYRKDFDFVSISSFSLIFYQPPPAEAVTPLPNFANR